MSGAKTVGEVKNHEDREGGRGGPYGFANRHLPKVSFSLHAETGKQGPVFRHWLQWTVNSFGSLEFSQAGTLRGTRDILWILPGNVRNYNSVCSSLYRPRWRHSQEKSDYSLVKDRILSAGILKSTL